MVRMKDERVPKRCETKKQGEGGCRRQGRPQLRWEDGVKRDLRKTEEEDQGTYLRKAEEEESGEKGQQQGAMGKITVQ